MIETLTDEEKKAIASILLTAANQVDNSFARGAIQGPNRSNIIRQLAFKVERMIGQKNDAYPY